MAYNLFQRVPSKANYVISISTANYMIQEAFIVFKIPKRGKNDVLAIHHLR